MPKRDGAATGTNDIEDDSQLFWTQARAQTALAETRLHFLKMLTLSVLDELNSLGSLGQGSKMPKFVLKKELQHFEAEIIRNALTSTGGVQRKAARLLGMNASTLNVKIKQFGINSTIESPDFSFEAVKADALDSDTRHLVNLNEAVANFEVELIKQALEYSAGSQTKAARSLGIPLTTLHCKMKKYKINPLNFPTQSHSPFAVKSSDTGIAETR